MVTIPHVDTVSHENKQMHTLSAANNWQKCYVAPHCCPTQLALSSAGCEWLGGSSASSSPSVVDREPSQLTEDVDPMLL